MLKFIENDYLTCTIESTGAEIRSLKSKRNGKEYIWQIDKSVWGSSSPVLFPAIGKIKDDKVLFQGKEYAMPKHGIIRNNYDLIFEQQGISKCTFTLTSSEKTLKQYPYVFSFTIEYTLIENRLAMNYIMENRDSVPLFFACGGHTAYACPISEDIKLSDSVIEFPFLLELESETLGDSGLLSYKKRKIETAENLLPLSNTLFNEDTLIFQDIDYDWVRIRKRNEEKGIVIRFKDYPHLALWSKPTADYICVEPWLGLPDREDESLDITEKSTYKAIEPGSKFSIAIETEIE